MLVQAENEQFGPLVPDKACLLEIYLKAPEDSLKRLVDTLGRDHDLTIAPYWPRIQEHLEGDTIKRGQALALGGVEALLSNLHPKASYSGSVLELDKTCEAVIEPRRGVSPPLSAQGCGARRAPPQRQESLLPLERRRRILARDLRRTGVDYNIRTSGLALPNLRG